MDVSDSHKSDPPEGQSPHPMPVQVQCDGFRCLAYRNPEGIWIDYCKGTPLTGTVHIVEEPAD